MAKTYKQAVGHMVGTKGRFSGIRQTGAVVAGVALLALLCCRGDAVGGAATVSLGLAWNANPESDISKYQLHYGTAPGVHPNMIEAGLNTSASVPGLVEGTTYYFEVSAWNQAGLESLASGEISYQVPVTPTLQVTEIARSGWSLRSVDSQALPGFAATRAFDGNTSTMWATDYLDPETKPPHEIQIDLGAVYPVAGFRYLPRQDAYVEGNIGAYEFYVSSDGTEWGAAVTSGSFTASKSEQEALFSAKSGRYVRLRILTEVTGDMNCAVAELKFLQGVISHSATLAEWAAANNLTALNAEPGASPQHDGVANLLKYAFSMNAAAPDVRVVTPGSGSAGLPYIGLVHSGETTVLHFEFLRRKNSSLIYTPRKTYDLNTWLPLSASSPQSVTSLDTEWERVVFAEPCNPTMPVSFGRVEVLMPTE